MKRSFLKIPVALALCSISVLASGADATKATVQAARENNTGVALMNQQLLAKALTHFEEAHKADPDSIVPVLNKGLALIYLRRLPEADSTLAAASAAKPANARLWYSLGLARFAAGNQEIALEDFRKAAQLDPSDADSHYYVAAAELALKDYPHAIEDFRKAIDLSPLHASAQYGLARALQRTGQVDEFKAHLKRFQEITQSNVGILFSTNYGEQGRYAMVQDMLALPAAVGPMIPVKFVPTVPSHAPAPAVAAGACILDVDGSGQKTIVSLGSGDKAIHLFRTSAAGIPQEIDAAAAGLKASGEGVSCAVGDYDNDNLPDLAVALADRVEIFRNLGHGKFANTTATLGIHPINQPAGITFVDFDHDGDLDLYVTGRSSTSGAGPSVLWRNNGNATFTEWTGPTGLAGTGQTTSATLSDINNDRAIDLLVAGSEPSPALFENQREGAFKRVALYDDPALGATRGAVTFDLNKDGWMDVAVTHTGAPGISLWKNVEGKRFERLPLPVDGLTGAWGLTPIDIDNDGWIDLAAIVEDPHGTHLRIFRNLGTAGFQDVSDALGLAAIDLAGARSLLAADIDGDGAADLIVPRGNAAPLILRNVGGSRNHSLRITLTGLADNKLGLGTKIEVFVNGSVQKFEAAGGSGYLGQGSTEILAGLGQETRVDVVRMLWPTGVPQDELDVSALKPVALTELDRRGSSCPVLFAWDGAKYQFVTDVIGAAVVGHWMSPTTRNHSDSDEWVKVDGSMLKPANGRLSLRFGEPMEEINYIDQLRLVAVDHPESTAVYPDERFLSEAPFASGKTVAASSNRHLPAGARGDHGEDVLPQLTRIDRDYIRDFDLLPYAGFTKPHTLTLELGPWSPSRPLRLLLSGYIEYFSASSMYSAWQAGLTPQPPTVEAQLPDGSWNRVIDDMGFPAGLPRTIVVDLTGKLPAGTERIRIRTNLQIYWDQILVDNDTVAPSTVRHTELPLATAHLAFRGYPRQVDGKLPGDLTYDYEKISATGPFQWQRGNYTHYGAVTPLLQAKDDRFVIFGSGEEIDAEFDAASLPPLPAHWKRDFFFYADGFVKDMDFYEALPFTVSQMPFHGMSTYPYPAAEHLRETDRTSTERLDWNDRFETGARTQFFQFNYAPVASTPIQ